VERWRSSKATAQTRPDPTPVYAIENVPRLAYTNLNLSYIINRGNAQIELFANIQNLFNTFPEAPTGGAPSTIRGRESRSSMSITEFDCTLTKWHH
jgi:outer membrane receptor protein involved in Fe transport